VTGFVRKSLFIVGGLVLLLLPAALAVPPILYSKQTTATTEIDQDAGEQIRRLASSAAPNCTSRRTRRNPPIRHTRWSIICNPSIGS